MKFVEVSSLHLPFRKICSQYREHQLGRMTIAIWQQVHRGFCEMEYFLLLCKQLHVPRWMFSVYHKHRLVGWRKYLHLSSIHWKYFYDYAGAWADSKVQWRMQSLLCLLFQFCGSQWKFWDNLNLIDRIRVRDFNPLVRLYLRTGSVNKKSSNHPTKISHLESEEIELRSLSYSAQQNQVNNINYFRFLRDSDFFTSDELCSKVLWQISFIQFFHFSFFICW